MSSALITQGAPLQSWRPLMMPWRTMRNAVITLTSMICAPASSFISPRSRALAIDGDGVVAAERANPRLGPAIAASGWLACTIEEPRDLLVWHQARQLADKQQRIIRNRPAMLADPIHLERQRGVVSALPMQDHLDEAAFDSHDDLVQCRAQDPLACRGCRGGVRPRAIKIRAELHQVLPLLLSQGRRLPRIDCGDLAFDPVHCL